MIIYTERFKYLFVVDMMGVGKAYVKIQGDWAYASQDVLERRTRLSPILV